MAINRTIQFKRNTTASSNAAAARDNILAISSQLANGEIVINTYIDANARNGLATMLGVKTQDKVYFIDNQTILNVLGINDDGTTNDSIADSIVKKIAADEDTIEKIITAAGLNADGTYTADATDPYLSGATSIDDATKKLSEEAVVAENKIKNIEDFIGISGDTPGESIVDKIDNISGDVTTISGNVNTISGDVENLITDVETLSGTVTGISEDLETVSGKVETLITNVETISGNVETLSGKTITDVEDTATIDFTKEDAADGTQKIKADVKISATNGNILSATTDGIYTSVDYDAVTNSLIINGVEKPMNAGSIIDSIEYSASTESLVINYHDASGGTHSTSAPLGDLIEEYNYPAKDENHNVAFTVTRNVSGATDIQAEVSVFDCGEY